MFIDNSNTVKLGDFGLSRPMDYDPAVKVKSAEFTDPTMTRSIGTSLYVAPEVKSSGGGNYNEKVDVSCELH